MDFRLLFTNPLYYGLQTKSVCVVDGEFRLVNKESNQKITDLQTWTDAFLVYRSIDISAHQEEPQEMLKYISTVILGASRVGGVGWREYDQQFRFKKARDNSISWAIVDQEL